mmetsp:Transcript_27319/g.77077  ORF Transcript_27319/g.77077 Transcript_27319/m.77077 type:complete len:431 (+) Transcript_27319:1782-3074(+)
MAIFTRGPAKASLPRCPISRKPQSRSSCSVHWVRRRACWKQALKLMAEFTSEKTTNMGSAVFHGRRAVRWKPPNRMHMALVVSFSLFCTPSGGEGPTQELWSEALVRHMATTATSVLFWGPGPVPGMAHTLGSGDTTWVREAESSPSGTWGSLRSHLGSLTSKSTVEPSLPLQVKVPRGLMSGKPVAMSLSRAASFDIALPVMRIWRGAAACAHSLMPISSVSLTSQSMRVCNRGPAALWKDTARLWCPQPGRARTSSGHGASMSSRRSFRANDTAIETSWNLAAISPPARESKSCPQYSATMSPTIHWASSSMTLQASGFAARICLRLQTRAATTYWQTGGELEEKESEAFWRWGTEIKFMDCMGSQEPVRLAALAAVRQNLVTSHRMASELAAASSRAACSWRSSRWLRAALWRSWLRMVFLSDWCTE